jgi:hypothetical protein
MPYSRGLAQPLCVKTKIGGFNHRNFSKLIKLDSENIKDEFGKILFTEPNQAEEKECLL